MNKTDLMAAFAAPTTPAALDLDAVIEAAENANAPLRVCGDGFLDHHTDALAAIGRAVLDQHYDRIADRIATRALATGPANRADAHTPPAAAVEAA